MFGIVLSLKTVLLLLAAQVASGSITVLTAMMSSLGPKTDVHVMRARFENEGWSPINSSAVGDSLKFMTNFISKAGELGHPPVQEEMAAKRTRDISQHRSVNIASTTESFECVSFPAEYSPQVFCSGVVDYPFMVPSGESVESLEEYVRLESLYMNAFLAPSCLSDYKRLICASIYLECVPGGKN
jgi:hypothetical protein